MYSFFALSAATYSLFENRIMSKFIDNFVHGMGTCIRELGAMCSKMTEVHWALFAVIVIGTGVLFMRGKPVSGA